MSKILKSLVLSLVIISSFSVVCFADTTTNTTTVTQNINITDINSKLQDALEKKNLDSYNTAYKLIMSITDEGIRNDLLNKLNSIKNDVYTAEIKYFTDIISKVQLIKDNNELIKKIESELMNSNLSNSDKAYLILELSGLNNLQYDYSINPDQVSSEVTTAITDDINNSLIALNDIKAIKTAINQNIVTDVKTDLANLQKVLDKIKDDNTRAALLGQVKSIVDESITNTEQLKNSTKIVVNNFNNADATKQYLATLDAVANGTASKTSDTLTNTTKAISTFNNLDSTKTFVQTVQVINTSTELSDTQKLLGLIDAYATFRSDDSTIAFVNQVQTIAKSTTNDVANVASTVKTATYSFKNADSTKIFKAQMDAIKEATNTSIKTQAQKIQSIIAAIKA